APAINLYRSGGTKSVPTVLGGTGSYSGYISFGGYDSASYVVGAQIIAQVGAQWSSSNHNISLTVSATPAQSANQIVVWRFNSNTDAGGDYNCNASSLPIGIGTGGANGGRIFWTTGINGFESSLFASITPVSNGILIGN